MAKVEQKTAGKDYPEFGIRKGDKYYTWGFFRQKPVKSKTPPTRQQLTQDSLKISAYNTIDNLHAELKGAEDLDDLRGVLDQGLDDIVEIKNKVESSKSELETHFTGGNRRITQLEKMYESLDSVECSISDFINNIDALDREGMDEEELEAEYDRVQSEAQEINVDF